MRLSVWATLTNRSGIDYRAAGVRLVAGKLNRVSAEGPRPVMFEALRAKAAAPAAEESFFEYHLYTLPRPVTLRDNQSKQVALMEASGIPVVREYLLRESGAYYRTASPEPRARPPSGCTSSFGTRRSPDSVNPFRRGCSGSTRAIRLETNALSARTASTLPRREARCGFVWERPST